MYAKFSGASTTKVSPHVITDSVESVRKEKVNYLKEYCDATSLHGWFFYGGSSSEKKTSPAGLFWMTILAASMSAAVFVMGTTIQEFRDATVQYNLDSATVSLDEVYFPSMVLCNMNTLRRSFIYTLINDVKLKNMNVTFAELQKIVHLIFIAGEDYELNKREEVMLEEMFNSDAYMGLFRELLANVKTEGILEKDWCNVPMVKWHALGETSINTTEEEARYSRTYVTELASQFREEEFLLRIKLKGSGVQFQVGFSTDVSESCIWLTPFIKPSEDMSDVRTVVPFAKNSLPNGMQLLVDVEAFDYAVSTTGSEGVIISILHQLDIPIMKNIGINVQPGQDAQIAITPTLISTNSGARKRFIPIRRQCYFEDEISLAHFPVEDGYRYEMSNCLFEATLQEVEKQCNCTPKYFVDISPGYDACEGKSKKCMNQLMVEMGDKREVVDVDEVKPCLAACIDQTHKFLVTQASYPNEDSFSGDTNYCLVVKKIVRSCKGDRRAVLDLKYPKLCPVVERETAELEVENIKCETESATDEPGSDFSNPALRSEVFKYAKENLAKVTIYIKDPYVSKYVTEEKITEIAFVGSVGGVLGLFMGFSFISAIEIIYVFCIKFVQAKCKG